MRLVGAGRDCAVDYPAPVYEAAGPDITHGRCPWIGPNLGRTGNITGFRRVAAGCSHRRIPFKSGTAAAVRKILQMQIIGAVSTCTDIRKKGHP